MKYNLYYNTIDGQSKFDQTIIGTKICEQIIHFKFDMHQPNMTETKKQYRKTVLASKMLQIPTLEKMY